MGLSFVDMGFDFTCIIPLAALILSVVNGFILVWNFSRDKPKLAVAPVLPVVYQWFFSLPNGEYQGQKTRKYGFLAYLAISNRGLRGVSVNSWHLYLKIADKKSIELKPMSIPEPKIRLGQSDHAKVYRVLGQKGQLFEGDMEVKAGISISGFAYYIAEFYGGDKYNPQIVDGKAIGVVVVKSVFGNTAKTKIQFTENLDKAKMMIHDIDKIDL
jgi:hypothetical protein